MIWVMIVLNVFQLGTKLNNSDCKQISIMIYLYIFLVLKQLHFKHILTDHFLNCQNQ